MARRDKDWGPIPSPDDVAQMMNSISKLRDDVADTEREYREVAAELQRRRDLYRNAESELGRMLRAAAPHYLETTEFRVLHRSEAEGDVLASQFGIGRMASDG